MLGIVIGIASVIILMSIGQSAQDLILNQVQGIGSNLIFVIPGGTNGKFQSPAAAQGVIIKTLVQSDVDALSREPSISGVAPIVNGQTNAVYGENNLNITYQGTTGNFFAMRNYTIVRDSRSPTRMLLHITMSRSSDPTLQIRFLARISIQSAKISALAATHFKSSAF